MSDWAQALQPESLTIEQGLSQGMVFDLLQSRDGFLWVATKDGLNRYDGYNFKVFDNDPFDAYSIASNTVTTLFEDSRGWLWIGFESKGIDVFIPSSGLFHHFNLQEQVKGNPFSLEISTIKESGDGSVWALLVSGGVVQIPVPAEWKQQLPESADLTAIAPPVLFPIGALQETLIQMDIKNDNVLIIASSLKQYVVDLHSKSIQTIEYPFQTRKVAKLAYTALHSEKDFWAIFPEAVVRCNNNQVTTFPIPNIKTERYLIIPASNNQIWLLIDRKMWLLSPDDQIDFDHPDWVMDECPTKVITDRNGNVWAGTLGYGLRKMNTRKSLFHAGAAGNSIWGFWRDNNGKYFCKIVNKIYPYHPETGMVEMVKPFPSAPSRLFDLSILPSGEIWTVGREEAETGIGLLLHYNAAGALEKSYSFPFTSFVYAHLLITDKGKIWITGGKGQLVCFDVATEQFENYNFSNAFENNINAALAIAIAADGNGNLWLGTHQGLLKCEINGNNVAFTRMVVTMENKDGLSSNSISCILTDPADPSGVLWIGTKGGGINRLDLRTGKVMHITTKDGLPNNVVYGIIPGNNHELWCSTNRGLARIILRSNEPLTYNITTFTAARGLQDNEFNTQAFSKAANGELLFGGIKGLNHFFPKEINLDSTPVPVCLVGLEINHVPVDYRAAESPVTLPLEALRSIDLDYDQNNLSFEFAALDFTDPRQNRYRYKMEGLDAEWVEAGDEHFAHFTHLDPGTYTFRYQGSNGEGEWQDGQTVITITIHPPWWRSNVAWLAYILLLLWAGYEAYKFQIRRVQLREQLAFEHRETERIKALEQMKTNFFANVTHEFRTPLTLILEPVRQLLQNPKDAQLTDKLKMVERNSQRLLAMVNQLLDLAKLEYGSTQLNLSAGDLAEKAKSTVQPFMSLAEKKHISLRFSGPVTPLQVICDQEKVELIINNLLSNALKFTPENGVVEVTLQTGKRLDRNIPTIELSVKDSGPGIKPELHKLVFERYFQVDDAQTRVSGGSGIGLALSKELAQLMGGDIDLQSTPGAGANFTFWIPWRTETTAPDTNALTDREPDGELPVVVLVEDNRDIRDLIKSALEGRWNVIEAADGQEGLRKIAENVPDLVITDLMMPFKDGYEVCHDVKASELTAHIPIIMLTAKTNLPSKLKGLRLGADDYITKPFSTEELIVRMKNLIDNRTRLKQLFSQVPVANPGTYEEKTFFSAPDNEFLRRLTETIEAHLDDETLGVEEFSAKMFVSRVQLHRKLKGLTGQTATDFIRNYRLDRAFTMLKNREGNVGEIAMRTGFVNEKYFSTVFKEKFGMSPGRIHE